jgi:hypothetical protein
MPLWASAPHSYNCTRVVAQPSYRCKTTIRGWIPSGFALQALTPLVEGIIQKDMERFREYVTAPAAEKVTAA